MIPEPVYLGVTSKHYYEIYPDECTYFEDIFPDDVDSDILIYFKHKRYTYFPKQTNYLESEFEAYNPGDFMDKLNKCEDYYVFELYMMDHSGLSFSISPEPFRACDPGRWDWGQVGFVLAKKTAFESYAKAKEAIVSFVEQMDAFHQGYVFYIVQVDRGTGEALDSVGGVLTTNLKDEIKHIFGEDEEIELLDRDEITYSIRWVPKTAKEVK